MVCPMLWVCLTLQVRSESSRRRWRRRPHANIATCLPDTARFRRAAPCRDRRGTERGVGAGGAYCVGASNLLPDRGGAGAVHGTRPDAPDRALPGRIGNAMSSYYLLD